MPKVARAVLKIIAGQPTRDGAGVDLIRTLGSTQLSQHDPFLLLDEFHSTDPNAYIAGFPSHPHRGFETVTYMLSGRMQHRDSMGNEGELGPGDIQWMTAGKGIIHSEMPLQEQGEMRGFQLWVNLPRSHKMGAPRYQDIPASRVPTVTLEDANIRVLSGHINGSSGPIFGVQVNPTLLDVALGPHGRVALDLPHTDQGFAYIFEGSTTLGQPQQTVQSQELATFGQGGPLVFQGGPLGMRALVGCARAIGEPVARYGPFVMNTQTEIQQAIADYQAGRLDKA